MIKRTIEISQQPAHLSVHLGQLRIRKHTDDESAPLMASVPCEDIGMLVVDHAQTTYSHHALAELIQAGAAVLICGANHLPAGMLLPFSNNHEVVWRINDQIAASKPVIKQLWKQLVVAKIRGQAATIAHDAVAQRSLLDDAKQVRSGDPTNREAVAAKTYWQAWRNDHAPNFRRQPQSNDPVNGMLNYGYAVLRAAVARALVSAGLQPAIGIHHANRSNPFCLADDLIEPLRPFVDHCVRELSINGHQQINRDVKQALLNLLAKTVCLDNTTGPLMVSLHRYTASLVQCLRGEFKQLLIPVGVCEPQSPPSSND